ASTRATAEVSTPSSRSARTRRSPRKPFEIAPKKVTGRPSRARPTATLKGEPPMRASSAMPVAVSATANTSISASPQTTTLPMAGGPSDTAAEAMLRLVAELRWRHSLDLAKAPVEVGDIVEAHLVADARDLAVGFHQQLAGAVDAHEVDEVGEGVAGGAAEKARE